MNLIICYTPLQVLIAEKIIEFHSSEPFYGAMIYVSKNAKFEFYSQRLEQKCVGFFSLHQHTDRLNLLKEIMQIKSHFWGKKFDKVFVASINDIQIQFLLSSIKFNELYTFDDGTANIVDSSVYYVDEPNTPIRRSINYLFRNKYSVERLKSLSKKHYTIYPNFKNIIDHIQPVDLFNQSENEIEDSEKIVNILLGQPVYLDNQKNIELAQKVVKAFNIDYYLPHPREQYTVENVNYIDTPLIFEDYMAQHYSNKKCRVYTYFSSAILNIKSSNIETVSLRIDVEQPDFIACYDLLEEMGIQIIDIRE